MKSLLPQGAYAPYVHPRLRKRPPRCTLDCGFKTPESPALRGFVAERGPITGTSLYLVLKSNGLRHSKNLPVKFSFSPKIVPANIAKKLPPQRCFKPLFIQVFNFSHKRSTFAFTGESGYTLGLRRKIAHSGLHAETGAFPPPATAGLCVASEIAPITTFATLDSATLLYTYISQFSVTPHLSAEEKYPSKLPLQLCSKPLFIAFFNFSHKRPTFAFPGESGYTYSALLKGSHTRAHTAKQGAFQLGVLSLPSERSARSRTSPGRVSERQTLPFLDLGRGCSRRAQKAFGTAMRLCASLFRGVAAPLGCAALLPLLIQHDLSERSVWMLRSDTLLQYNFFYNGDNDYRNSVVSFCNTALLLISDFFSTPLAK